MNKIQTTNELRQEDYVEPRCLLCDEPYGRAPEVKAVPQRRIIDKMDEYMSRRDYDGAERHLLYWLEEAKLGHDLRGQLLINNELVGHYRKVGNKARSFACGDEALRLVEKMEYDGSISSGTTYVNIATACNAFGENARALELFRRAEAVYLDSDQTRPDLLGGLFNNMALTLAAEKRYDEARIYYDKAMEQMGRVPAGILEQAITQLNLANLIEDEQGLEAGEAEINALLDRAYEMLEAPSVPRDGYYAFVCEKCAPTFSYYGRFREAGDLKGRAEAIYTQA